jgi:hypothetical protein
MDAGGCVTFANCACVGDVMAMKLRMSLRKNISLLLNLVVGVTPIRMGMGMVVALPVLLRVNSKSMILTRRL